MIDYNVIPKSWKPLKLGEVCKVRNGYAFKSADFKDNGVLLFRQTNLDGENVKLKNAVYLPEEYLEKYQEYKISKGDVLVGMSGSIGKMCVYNLDKPALQNQRTGLLRFTDLVEKKFIRYYFEVLEQVFVKKSKGVAVLNISAKDIQESEFHLPSLSEQQAIVSKIEELLSDLENGKQQLLTAQQQLKVYRQSLLKWAFEGKLSGEWRKQQNNLQSSSQLLKMIKKEREEILKSNGIKIKPIQTISEEEKEELPILPNGIVWLKLGEILWSVKDGPHYSPKYQKDGIPFISGGNIRPNGIDFKNVKYISLELHEELSKRCKPMNMDVLYTKGGTTGIAKVNDYDIDFNVWVHIAVLKAIPSINPYYLEYVLNSNHCYKQSQKYTHGVGNQDLGLTRMILITLPICSLEEQNYIVEELESKLTVCDKIEETISNSLQQAETLRQSILKKAFEGRLV